MVGRPLFFLLALAACGARTNLGVPIAVDAGVHLDATMDHAPDVGAPDVVGGACVEGVLTQYPTSECGGDQVDWFATPYTPTGDITVDRVEAYMAQGNVALLTDSAGTPGAVLFQGSVGTSNPKAWIGADVNPPVSLKGGVPYWIGFQGDCSFASNGPEPPEYIAHSIDGPWTFTGTDNWTARLIGTCP